MLLTHEEHENGEWISSLAFQHCLPFQQWKKKDVSVDPWDGKIDQSSQLFFDSHKQLIF